MAVGRIVFRATSLGTLLHNVIIRNEEDICHWFTMVTFSGQCASSIELPPLLPYLQWALPARKLPNLVSVSVKGDPVASLPCTSFIRAILGLSTLTTLHIQGSGYHPGTVVELLYGLRSLPLLTDLMIPYPDSGDDPVGYTSVVNLHTVAPQLRHLSLRDMDEFDAGDSIAGLCTSLPELVTLNMTNQEATSHTDGGGITLTCNCRTLPRLRSYGTRIRRAAAWEAVARCPSGVYKCTSNELCGVRRRAGSVATGYCRIIRIGVPGGRLCR